MKMKELERVKDGRKKKTKKTWKIRASNRKKRSVAHVSAALRRLDFLHPNCFIGR